MSSSISSPTDRSAAWKALKQVEPAFLPLLDPGFRPACLAVQAFQYEVATNGVPLIIGIAREHGEFYQHVTQVFPEDHPYAPANYMYIERLLKFLLWQRGGYQIYIGGPRCIGDYIRDCYSPNGLRQFDAALLGEQVYERPFTVIPCLPADVPPTRETGTHLGRHLDGCRIGFDLGASDRKVSAVIEGRVVYSEEVIWEPRKHADPNYHYTEILSALKMAASKLPRVDAIGGSSAGIYIDNRPMVASLFRSVPAEHYGQIRNLFLRIRAELNVPLEVINDGDVTALAGAMSLGENGILGIAMGSSQAAGYVDMNGHVMGWLNELAFAPVDYSPNAPKDEWSGDTGCGSQYFSQQCVFRLAPKAGIQIPTDVTDAEKLEFVQDKLKTGHPGAAQIWESIGVYLGYALAHYANFYQIKNVLILGRVTSDPGGELILEWANRVLQSEFPELAAQLRIQLPDEHSRRIGQAIAAASLPILQP